jgi:hypothetical protein
MLAFLFLHQYSYMTHFHKIQIDRLSNVALALQEVQIHRQFLHKPTVPPQNIVSLCSCTVADQVSHPYKTTGKGTFLSSLIFVFLDTKRKTKDMTVSRFQV